MCIEHWDWDSITNPLHLCLWRFIKTIYPQEGPVDVKLAYWSSLQPNNCSAKYKKIHRTYNSLLYWKHANPSKMPDPRVNMHMH